MFVPAVTLEIQILTPAHLFSRLRFHEKKVNQSIFLRIIHGQYKLSIKQVCIVIKLLNGNGNIKA